MYKHLVYVPFTGLGVRKGFRGNTWLKNRIEIFKEYTVRSLLNQTTQDYILWVSWRPEERNNKQVKELKEYLDQWFSVVFTFGGVCFWDDKHEDDDLLYRLHHTLPELERVVGDADYVLVTLQPSDDMYLEDSLEVMKQHLNLFDYDAVGFGMGYLMNYATKEIARYNPTTNPPFYTIKFKKEVFLDPQKHYEFIGPYKSHEYVNQFMDYFTIPGRGFVVGTHGENISTTFIHPFKGRLLDAEERNDILKKTGTQLSRPIVVKRRMRLILRNIFNRLPFQAQLRKIYHQL